MTWSLFNLPLKAVTSTLLRTILCLRQNALCKTPKRDNWWPDQVFKDYSVVCAISTTSRQWSHLRVFDSFSKQYFSKDTIAGDANAAAYTYFKKQQNQDFYNSSVAVMLRKMQREFNTGRPFESRLHFDSCTNDDFSQLISASDLGLLFHGYSLTVKTTWTQNHERILEQLACASARQREKTSWGQLSSQLYWSHWWGRRLKRAVQTQRNLTIPWLHFKIMMSVNPDEAWSSKTEIFGYDKQICPGIFLFFWPFVRCPSKNYRARSPAKLKVREDETEEAKKQKIPKKRDEEWNSTRWKYSSWTWTTSSSSSAWQEWSSDETRERTNWQSADWDSSDQVRKASVWQSHFSWQWGHLHKIVTSAPMTTKTTSFCDGVHFCAISATCLVCCERRVDCHSSFSCHKHEPVSALLFILFIFWLKAK